MRHPLLAAAESRHALQRERAVQRPRRPAAPDTPKSKHKICLFNLPVVVRGEKVSPCLECPSAALSVQPEYDSHCLWEGGRGGEGEERREREKTRRGRGGGGKGEEEGYLNTFSER